MATVLVDPQWSYTGQPLPIFLDGLMQGIIEEIEIHDSTLANPARASSIRLFAQLTPMMEEEIQRRSLSHNDARHGWVLQGATREAMDTILSVLQAYNRGHERQVRVRMIS